MVRPLYGLFQAVGFILDVVGAPFRYAIELLRYPFLSEKDKKAQAYNLAKLDARIREDLRKGLNMLTLGFAFKEKSSFGNIYGNKGAQKEMMGKMAGGGRPITRGGRLVDTPVKRTVQKPKAKRSLKIQPTVVKPGKSVGGEDKLKKLFPGDADNPTKDTVNPLGYMKSSYKKFSETGGFGGLAALFMKAQLGERPSDLDYQNAASGLQAWMQRTFSDEIMRTGGAFAEGGEVNVGMFSNNADMKNTIAKSIQDSVAPKIDDTINDLMKQLGLKGVVGEEKEKVPSSGQEGVEGPEDFSGSTGAEKTMHYLISQGLTGAQAAGIAGNLQQESGFNPNPSGNPTHHGIAQWDNEIRWPRVSAYIRSVGRDPNTLEGQLVGLKWEAQKRGDWEKIKATSSARDASAAWLKWFEISGEGPGTRGFENRMKYANELLAKYGNYVPASTGAGGVDISGLSGKGGLKQYITGDHTDKAHYAADHDSIAGRRDNYHDHLAFNDRKTTIAAYNFFKSKGFTVTELLGNPYSAAELAERHTGPDHPAGLAFDVPGSQWGGTPGTSSGPREWNGSARVRATLKEFLSKPMYKGGRINGLTFIKGGEKGPEFIFDADTTKGLDSLAPGLLEKLNIAKTKSQLASILQSYAGYEDGGEQVVYVDSPEPQIVPMMMPIPMGSGMVGGGGGVETSDYDSLYHGH